MPAGGFIENILSLSEKQGSGMPAFILQSSHPVPMDMKTQTLLLSWTCTPFSTPVRVHYIISLLGYHSYFQYPFQFSSFMNEKNKNTGKPLLVDVRSGMFSFLFVP